MRPSARLAVLLCAALSACHGEPIAPDPIPPSQMGILTPGPYLLSVGIVTEQATSCIGRLEAWGLFGPNLGALITLSAQGESWVGRVEPPAAGTLELQLRQGNDAAAITGTLRGTMTHFLDRLVSTPPRTLSFAGKNANGSATLEARLFDPSAIIGTASGEITFTDTSGSPLACPAVALTLSRQR